MSYFSTVYSGFKYHADVNWASLIWCFLNADLERHILIMMSINSASKQVGRRGKLKIQFAYLFAQDLPVIKSSHNGNSTSNYRT